MGDNTGLLDLFFYCPASRRTGDTDGLTSASGGVTPLIHCGHQGGNAPRTPGTVTLLDGEVGEEVVQPLLLLHLLLLELVDLLVELLDLGLLLVELVQVAFVRLGGWWHLLQVSPQPALVLGD